MYRYVITYKIIDSSVNLTMNVRAKDRLEAINNFNSNYPEYFLLGIS